MLRLITNYVSWQKTAVVAALWRRDAHPTTPRPAFATPNGSIQCEYVSVDDYANMVRVCVALACEGSKAPDPTRVLRNTLEKKAAAVAPFVRPLT